MLSYVEVGFLSRGWVGRYEGGKVGMLSGIYHLGVVFVVLGGGDRWFFRGEFVFGLNLFSGAGLRRNRLCFSSSAVARWYTFCED